MLDDGAKTGVFVKLVNILRRRLSVFRFASLCRKPAGGDSGIENHAPMAFTGWVIKLALAMQIISTLKSKNIWIAAAIGSTLGLIAGAKGEGCLVFSVAFGLLIGGFVGWLGLPERKVQSTPRRDHNKDPE